MKKYLVVKNRIHLKKIRMEQQMSKHVAVGLPYYLTACILKNTEGIFGGQRRN